MFEKSSTSRGREYLSWPRIELRNIVRTLLHLFDADAHPSRNFRETPFAQILHVVGNNLVFEVALFSLALELNQQAFAEIARSHAGRIKTLNERKHRFEIILRNAGVERHFCRRRLQKSIVIDVPNNQLSRFSVVGVKHCLVKLPHEVLLQGFLRGD